MQSYMSIAFIILAIGGLLGQQEFCYDHYCYRTDGELKNVTSLKDAQDYCYKNDSASWLLEIYGYYQFKSIRNSYLKGSVLLNSIGTVAKNWTSVFNGPLPSGLNIDESLGQDFLYLKVSGGKLYFQGADKNTLGSFICRVSGNCSDGNCFEIMISISKWFEAETSSFTKQKKVDKDYGHLATFDAMTYEEISNLNFVNKLAENTAFWIGYSKLVYTLQHSNVRNYYLPFHDPYPLLTASHPNESYFVYYDSDDDNFKEKPFGDAQFQIICMIDNTTLELTSTPTTTTSDNTTLELTTTPTTITSVVTATTEQTSTTVFPTSAFTTTMTSFEPTTSLPTSDTTATTRHTSTPATPTSVSSDTATHWNSLETNPTTAGLKASNETKESTIILSFLLPILLWLVFSISFICCFLPYYINRNTRREATIP